MVLVVWSQSLVRLLQPHELYSTRLLHPWDFSRQEYWSGLPFPSPGDLPDPRIKPVSLLLQVDSLPTKSPNIFIYLYMHTHTHTPFSKTILSLKCLMFIPHLLKLLRSLFAQLQVLMVCKVPWYLILEMLKAWTSMVSGQQKLRRIWP